MKLKLFCVPSVLLSPSGLSLPPFCEGESSSLLVLDAKLQIVPQGLQSHTCCQLPNAQPRDFKAAICKIPRMSNTLALGLAVRLATNQMKQHFKNQDT